MTRTTLESELVQAERSTRELGQLVEDAIRFVAAPEKVVPLCLLDGAPAGAIRPVGEAADHAAMHLVAEASVRAFLTRVAGILERKAMSRLLAVAEPFPHGE